MELIFISCLVYFSFQLFINVWVINFLNSTSCILLKQKFKVIIIIVVVCRCESIQKSSTGINLLQVIFNRSNCGTSAHYIINIKNIIDMYSCFESQGHILQGYILLIENHNTFGWVV